MSINSLPRLGLDLSIDIDKLETYKPDLVLASLSVPGMEKNVAELKKRQIPHIVLDQQSLDDIAQGIAWTNRNKFQCISPHLFAKFSRIITNALLVDCQK